MRQHHPAHRPLLGAAMLVTVLSGAWSEEPPAVTGHGGTTAQEQHAAIGAAATNAPAHPHTRHPDAQWFGEAGLGLFIHWSIASVHGDIDMSWSMIAQKPWDPPKPVPGAATTVITPEDYFALAPRFKPDQYNPDKWLRAAKEAGFRYAVFTTKHHDGYAMWPSDVGDFGVKQYLPGVDFVKGYVEACRKHGLKVGIYYSPPDWHFNRHYMSFAYDSMHPSTAKTHHLLNLRHEAVDALPARPQGFNDAYLAYIRAQVKELLTRYGTIDLLWFDGGPNAIPVDDIRALQPGIVINPRMHGTGDFSTPEGHMPDGPLAGWWELCDVWAPYTWGYNTTHEQYKSSGWMLAELTKVRGWGGNLLINASPRPSGEMPDTYYERMHEVAAWMAHSRTALFNVHAGPYPATVNVPVTIRDDTWFLLVPPEHQGAITLRRTDPPTSVTLLKSGTVLTPVIRDGVCTIDIPTTERSALVDVIAVNYGKSP